MSNDDQTPNEGKYLYLACTKYDSEIYLKIGLTNNINERMRKIVTNCPIPLRVVFYTYKEWENETKVLEKILHHYLRDYKIHHEWFKPKLEFFDAMEKLLEKFKGKLNWEEMVNFLEELESEIPSLNAYSTEAFELVNHFSEIVWKSSVFEWKDKKYILKDKDFMSDYRDMYRLIEKT